MGLYHAGLSIIQQQPTDIIFDRTIFSPTNVPPLNSDDSGLSGYTSLVKLLPAVLQNSANYIRAGLMAPGTGSMVINDFTICRVAASGDAYDGAATPTPFLFNGSASITLTAGQTVSTDVLDFTLDNTKAYIFGFNIGASSRVRYRSSLSSSHIHYKMAAVQEADSANRTTGYSTQSGRVFCMYLLEGAP